MLMFVLLSIIQINTHSETITMIKVQNDQWLFWNNNSSKSTDACDLFGLIAFLLVTSNLDFNIYLDFAGPNFKRLACLWNMKECLDNHYLKFLYFKFQEYYFNSCSWMFLHMLLLILERSLGTIFSWSIVDGS